MSVLVGSLLPQPTPPDPDPDLLALWRRWAPVRRPAQEAADEAAHMEALGGLRPPTDRPTGDGHGDPEDWAEMAARLRALLTSGADTLWLSWGLRGDVRPGVVAEHVPAPASPERPDGWEPTGRTISTAVAAAMIEGDEAEHYGPLQTRAPLMRVSNNRADRYFDHDVFTRHAGRSSVRAGISDEEEPFEGLTVEAEMSRLARAGYRHAFIKHVAVKRGVWAAPTNAADRANYEAVFDALGWDVVRYGGRARAFVVQPHVPMRFEYRLFVVDDQPVTGAGCIEHHTPIHNDGTPFDAAVIEHRPTGVSLESAATGDPPVEARPDIRDEAVAFGRTVAADIAASGSPFGRAYVLDVALGDDGWLVVEYNGLDNAGLYASDPARVTRALVGSTAARPAHPAAGRPSTPDAA